MIRWVAVLAVFLGGVGGAVAAFLWSDWWLVLGIPLLMFGTNGVYDLLQTKHSVTRNYPVIGHARFLLEKIRPEMQRVQRQRSQRRMAFASGAGCAQCDLAFVARRHLHPRRLAHDAHHGPHGGRLQHRDQ